MMNINNIKYNLSGICILMILLVNVSCSFSDHSETNNSETVKFYNASPMCGTKCNGLNQPNNFQVSINNDSIVGLIEILNIPDSIRVNYRIGKSGKIEANIYEIDYKYNFVLENDTFPSFSISVNYKTDSTNVHYVKYEDLKLNVDFQNCFPDGGCSWVNSEYTKRVLIEGQTIKFTIKPNNKLISFENLKMAKVTFNVNVWEHEPHIESEELIK